MSETRYDILFSGQIMEGRDPAQVRTAVARMFQADDATLARLFSGRPIRIKSAVDQETAIQYRVAFRDAGALVEVRPVTQESPTQTTAPEPDSPPPAGDPELLPPRTGDLSDCLPPVEPAPLPDISGITLAAEGTTIDESPPPPPLRVDTSGLTLAPAASGSLEDCQRPAEAAPLPDISDLKLADD